MKRKWCSILLVLCLSFSLALPVSASEMGSLESYGVQLIQYYLHHQDKATDVIWDITRQMKEKDPKQGAVWEKIMFDWDWINGDMPIYEEVLPEDLPTDDSLCILVMGFGLNADGSIRPELQNRLMVALDLAQKACTLSIREDMDLALEARNKLLQTVLHGEPALERWETLGQYAEAAGVTRKSLEKEAKAAALKEKLKFWKYLKKIK